MELSFLGAKVPGNDSSKERKFHPIELSFPGAKVLRNESSCYPLLQPHSSERLLPSARNSDDISRFVPVFGTSNQFLKIAASYTVSYFVPASNRLTPRQPANGTGNGNTTTFVLLSPRVTKSPKHRSVSAHCKLAKNCQYLTQIVVCNKQRQQSCKNVNN